LYTDYFFYSATDQRGFQIAKARHVMCRLTNKAKGLRDVAAPTSRIPDRHCAPALTKCGRSGQYRKQNLIEKYGADIRLPDLREEIAQCGRQGKMHDACMVHYVELKPK
jgi:hypothetical protein